MTLKQCIRDFPIGCDPNPNSTPSIQPHMTVSYDHNDDDHDEDYKPYEDLNNFIDITDDLPDVQQGYSESEKHEFWFRSGFGLKRKVSAVRDFPPGCGTGVSSYSYGYLADIGKDEEEEEVVIMEDEVPLSSRVGDILDTQQGFSESEKPMFGFGFGFGLKRKVSAVRDFPPGCGTGVSSYSYGHLADIGKDEEEEEEEVIMEDEVPLASRVGDILDTQQGFSGSEKPMFGFGFGFGLKRKVYAVRDFPPGCGMGVSSHDYGYLADNKSPSWFERQGGGGGEEGEVIMEDEVPLSSRVDDWAADKEVGLGLGSGKLEFGSAQESERKSEAVVVLGLMASQFCPWNKKSKGIVKKKAKKF